MINDYNKQIDSLKKKNETLEIALFDKSKEFNLLQVSNEVSSAEDYIDEIQQLKLQLGKKDLTIVKFESEIKTLKVQLNGIF